MPFSSYPVLVPAGVGHPRVSALRPLLWEERGTFCSSSRLPSRERSSLVMVPHRAASSSARSSCAPSRPMRVTTSPAWTSGRAVTSTSSWSMHIRPAMGQKVPRISTRPPCWGSWRGRPSAYPMVTTASRVSWRAWKASPYPARSPGRRGRTEATRARRERTGFRSRRRWTGGEGAVHTVQGDAGPGPGAWLGRQIEDPVAGLDVDAARREVLGAHPVQRVIEQGELFQSRVHVLFFQAVGDAQMGEHPVDAQIFQTVHPGDGGAVPGGQPQPGACRYPRARWTRTGPPWAASARP